MAYGRHHEAVFVRQIEAIQTVDQLRAIRHGNFFRMAVEKVERHPAEHRIAQRRQLLELISWRGLASRPVPRPPLIHHQLHQMLRIFLAHDLPVTVDQPFHAVAFAKQFIPVHGIEGESIALALHPVARAAPAQVPGIMMQCPSVKATQRKSAFARDFLEETASPGPVVDIWTRSNK